jgi:hypothetical protein
VIDSRGFADVVSATVDELVEISPYLPEGAVVGRRLKHLVWRSEPSELG